MFSHAALKRGWKAYMAIMSLIGVFALFIPLDGLIGNSDTLPRKIIETIFLLFALYVVTHIVVFSIFRIIGKISRKILVAPLNNGKKCLFCLEIY